MKSAHVLDAFFRPQSIAVIGAKDSKNSVGRTLMVNLSSSGFEGRIIPVNPHRGEVLGIPCFKSVLDVPSTIDLAVIAVPAQNVVEVMHTCGKAHVKAVVIISAGFGELGEKGRAREEAVHDVAKAYGMRVIGPNCLGIMNPALGLNATFARGMARVGTLAFISQSGAFCTAVLDWSVKEEIGFSAFVSVGSMIDVDWGDLLEYFGEDYSTKSILMYMESIRDPRSFFCAAKEVSWRKPIIVIKPGRSKEGAHAAASHTGALVEQDEVFDALCERAGILRVDRVAELFDMAEVLARQPRPLGPRLGIVTNAGGPAVLATDATIEQKGLMAHLSDGTMSHLDKLLPPAWSHGNPVDILGDASPDRFKDAVQAVLKDTSTDGALVILTPQDMTDPARTAQAICDVAKNTKKPLLTSWMGGETVEEGKRILATFGIPSFSYPDDAAWAFAMMWKQENMLQELFRSPRLRVVKSIQERSERRKKAKKLIEEKTAENGVLSERSSKELLALYGFSVVVPEFAACQEDACRIASTIGFPVVVKMEDELITHKSRNKGVFLRLETTEAVRKAFLAIEETFFTQGLSFKGVTVQKMIEQEGVELIVGSKRDEHFGQVILFGAGGVHVESLSDLSIGFPPLTTLLAESMIDKTKVSEALKNFAGGELVPIEVISEFLVQFSEMIIENPEISECDINPLLVTASGILCLDARVVIDKDIIPQNVIPPYAEEYEREVSDNEQLRIRPVRPEDSLSMKLFHEELSNSPFYKDMFAFLPFQKLPLDTLLHLCHLESRIVLIVESVEDHRIYGVAALKKGETSDLFLVFDMNERVGELLITNILEIAKSNGIQTLHVRVKSTNHPMINLLSGRFREVSRKDGTIVYAAQS